MKRLVYELLLCPIVLSTFSVAASTQAQCDFQWANDPLFLWTAADDRVRAMIVYDYGEGPELYIGGTWSKFCGKSMGGAVRWNGTRWATLGAQLVNGRGSFAIFDSGAGPVLYMGSEAGSVTNYLKTWDGKTVVTVPNPMGFRNVYDLTVFDDGTGQALYAAVSTGAPVQYRVARWDGVSWTLVGEAANSFVLQLLPFDDGNGPALYAGGMFTNIGGAGADRLARWNGFAWTSLGAGVNGAVREFAVYDDGQGSALYIGSTFTSAGGQPANHLARFKSGQVTPVLINPSDSATAVNAMLVSAGSGGSKLYIAGQFNTVQSIQVSNAFVWDGVSIEPLAGYLQGAIYSLGEYDDGDTTDIFCGGDFEPHIAKLGDNDWIGVGHGVSGEIFELKSANFEGKDQLFAAGRFKYVDEKYAGSVASWDGANWHALGTGINGVVETIEFHDDGSGAGVELYAGGDFGGLAGPRRIAKWDGVQWQEIGTGLNDNVHSMRVFNDGGGDRLVVAGSFTADHSGTVLNRIACWDGNAWCALGPGMANWSVDHLHVHDDGNGPALYASGGFTMIGTAPIKGIAKWDGKTWSGVGDPQAITGAIGPLISHDDGNGYSLFAAGSFNIDGSVARVARWNGKSWYMVSPPFDSGNSIVDFEVFDSGRGNELYAVGAFMNNATMLRRVGRWDGQQWNPLGSGLNETPPADLGLAGRTIEAFDFGAGPELFVGGAFYDAGGKVSHCLARWGPPRPSMSRHPTDVSVPMNATAAFRVVVSGGEPLEYQWMKDGIALADGANVIGAQTHELRILATTLSDIASYQVAVSNECGNIESLSAMLHVDLCPTDIVSDHVVNNMDLLAVIAQWGACNSCPADVVPPNPDGNVNVDDLLAVINTWGPCP